MNLSTLNRLLFSFTTLSLLGTAFADPYYGSENCNRISAHGEYLYWQVAQDEMQYAANLPGGIEELVQAANNPDLPLPQLSIIEPSFEYKSGFRIGLGYEDLNSNWDVTFDWTRLHQTVNSNVSSNTNGILPLAFPASTLLGVIVRTPTSLDFGREAKSSWKFQFDTYDLKIGKNYSFLNCLVCHPYIGVKGASIKQNQHVQYLGITINSAPISLDYYKKNNFCGVGPSFGFESSWEIYSDLKLSSGIGASLLYGKFKVEQAPGATIDPIVLEVNLKNTNKSRLRPAIDANIGLDWSTCLCDQFPVTVGIGYELQYWWNQWQAPSSALSSLLSGGATSHGDLMMQGLTANLAISF